MILVVFINEAFEKVDKFDSGQGGRFKREDVFSQLLAHIAQSEHLLCAKKGKCFDAVVVG